MGLLGAVEVEQHLGQRDPGAAGVLAADCDGLSEQADGAVVVTGSVPGLSGLDQDLAPLVGVVGQLRSSSRAHSAAACAVPLVILGKMRTRRQTGRPACRDAGDRQRVIMHDVCGPCRRRSTAEQRRAPPCAESCS